MDGVASHGLRIGWCRGTPRLGMGNGSTASPRLGMGNGSTASPMLGMGYGSTASPMLGMGFGSTASPRLGMGNGSMASSMLAMGYGSTASPTLGMGYGSTASLTLGMGNGSTASPMWGMGYGFPNVGDGLWVCGIAKGATSPYLFLGGVGDWKGTPPYVFLGGGLSPKRWRSELRPVLPACLPAGDWRWCYVVASRSRCERASGGSERR